MKSFFHLFSGFAATTTTHGDLARCVSALFLILLFAVPLSAQTYSGGSGTENDPYLISSKADMEALANAVNNGSNYSSGKYFLLTQDITEVVTTVIGNTDNVSRSFLGTFDGGGHSIDVNISASTYAGVFGCISGTIKNLKVMGSISGVYFAGGICGVASNSTIMNCSNTGNISSYYYYDSYSGGICGYASGNTITNCSNIGNISSSSSNNNNAFAGGICGYAGNTSTITNCSNTGNISSTTTSSYIAYAGGICGELYSGKISNCIASNVTITGRVSYVGRIVGNLYMGTVENCYALASMRLNGATISSQNANSKDGKDISDVGDDPGNIYHANFSVCSQIATTILLNTSNTIKWQRSDNNEQSWEDIDCTLPFYTETDPAAGAYVYRALNGEGTYSNYVRGVYYDAVPSVINTLPLANVSKTVDENITFSLDATDDNYNYQWYRTNTLINGATNNSWSTPEIKTADAGTYRCRVWNICNVTVSSNTMLVVEKATQVITLPETTLTKGYGDEDFYLPETTDKKLSIVYSSSNSSVATVTGNKVHITGLGATTITASQAGNSEYIAASPVTLSLTVTKGQQTITFGALPVKTYGDAAFALSASVNSGRAMSYESSNTNVATVSGNTLTIRGAGAVTVTAFAAGNEYYDAATPVQQQLTVNKAALTATADNKSRLYGAENPEFTITYSGFKNTDNPNSLTQAPTASCDVHTASVTGEYAIVLSGGESQNYEFTLINGALTVERATVTVTALAATSVYGDAPPAFGCQYAGFVNDETEAVLTTPPALTCSASATSGAGAYSIVPSGAAAQNYSFVYQNGTLTITKRPLNVTPNDATRVYGNSNPAYTFTYTGFVNGDNAAAITTSPAGATNATVSSPVGDYTITCSGGNASNYSFVYGTGKLTITKASLTATADNKSRVYGAANPTFTISYSGFRNSDNQNSLTQAPTATCAATSTSAVGNYAIVLSDGSAQNYDFVFNNGTLSVGRASVTVTARAATSVYGDSPPAFTCQYTGFANGETEAVLTTLPALSCNAGATSSVGSYSIVPSGAMAQNYNFVYQNGVLSINKRPLQATPNSVSREYGSANPGLTVSLSGFVNGDSENVVSARPTATTTATATSAAGAYTITCSGGNATNYSFTYGAGTLTVAKAPLTIAVHNATRLQGQPNPVFTFSYSGFKNNENYLVLDELPVANCVANENSVAGFYEIVLSGGNDKNYGYTLINGTLEVTASATTPVITITTHPAASITVTQGSITGSLSIAASVTQGADLTCQWYSNTSASNAGGSIISGATGSSFILPATLTAGTYFYFCEVRATGAVSVRSNVATVRVNPQQVTSVEISDVPLASVYPNPTDGMVSLEFETTGDYVVTVSDMTGKIHLRQTVNDQIASLDLSNLPSGVYLLKIDNDKRQTVTRIVKN